uniref:Transmembrane protein 273 n=1 Tax=Chelonoidis abingdonii TaxID=106734 RepID=A0A8C0GHE3_CHEAB
MISIPPGFLSPLHLHRIVYICLQSCLPTQGLLSAFPCTPPLNFPGLCRSLPFHPLAFLSTNSIDHMPVVATEMPRDPKYVIIGVTLGVFLAIGFLALKICMIKRQLTDNDFVGKRNILLLSDLEGNSSHSSTEQS